MDKKLDPQQMLPLAILAVAGVLLYIGLTDSGKPSPSARSARVQDSVNKHLEKTAEKLEMQRQRMQVENARLAMEYSRTMPDRPIAPPGEGAELIHDQRSERIAEDLGVERRQESPTNPMDMIHQQLFEAQRSQQLSEAYKKAYAQQFIENARRGGYEVKLSDDFRVLSVKPIRRPSGDRLYNGE